MKKQTRKAFTLIEVLISITLLSFVLMALYKSADILRDSNLHLFKHLQKANDSLIGSKTLYMDLMKADHNISIITEEKFHRLTIENTTNSLYGLGSAKITWLIAKEENALLRIEGGKYSIPLRSEENVEVDLVFKDIEMFKVYQSKKKDKILAILKIKGRDAQSFLVQSIPFVPADNNRTMVNNPSNQNPLEPQVNPINN